jgi:hypothetical protein
MHFVTRVRTWRVARLTLSWRSFMRAVGSIKPCPDQGERERVHERELLTNSRAQTKAIANASTN